MIITYAETLSTAAIVISLGSFALSAMGAVRDRPRIKVTSTLWDNSPEPNVLPTIHVVVVNKGRRPIIMRVLGGSNADNSSWSGTFLDHAKGGVRIGEYERWEYEIKNDETIYIDTNGGDDFLFTQMWIEDTLGNRYSIPNAKRFLPVLQETLFSKNATAR